jgi:hypothetical protein
MYVEEPGVAGRLKPVNAEAARFLTRRSEDVEQHLGHRILIARTRVKSREDEQFHAISPHGRAIEKSNRADR